MQSSLQSFTENTAFQLNNNSKENTFRLQPLLKQLPYTQCMTCFTEIDNNSIADHFQSQCMNCSAEMNSANIRIFRSNSTIWLLPLYYVKYLTRPFTWFYMCLNGSIENGVRAEHSNGATMVSSCSKSGPLRSLNWKYFQDCCLGESSLQNMRISGYARLPNMQQCNRDQLTNIRLLSKQLSKYVKALSFQH